MSTERVTDNQKDQRVQQEIADIMALTPSGSRKERLQRGAEMAQLYARLRQN
ncbi:MAG: hypothetical protein ACOZBZ_00190 [Patescibacteria group bacterium]